MRRRFWFAIAILAAVHLYIWWRLVLPLPSPAWQLGTVIVAVLGPTFPETLFVGRRLPRERARPWLLVGYLWFGFATYLLLARGATSVIAFGARCAKRRWAASRRGDRRSRGLVNVARAPDRQARARPAREARRRCIHDRAAHGCPHRPADRRAYARRSWRCVKRTRRDVVVITGDFIAAASPSCARTSSRSARCAAGTGYAVTGKPRVLLERRRLARHIRSLGIQGSATRMSSSAVRPRQRASTTSHGRGRGARSRRSRPDLKVVLLAHHRAHIARA